MEELGMAAEAARIELEEQQDEHVQHTYFNASINDFDFKNDDFFISDGFEFDENFQCQDAGQLRSHSTVLKSTELLQNLLSLNQGKKRSQYRYSRYF
jgi:hypothetical protein